jgi:sugar phosphate isomerase/epimerase
MQLCYALRRGVYYPSQRDAFGEMPPKQYRATYLAKVKKLGFDTLEVPAWYEEDAEKHAKEFRAEIEGAGLAIGCVRAGGPVIDPIQGPKVVARLKQAVKYAAWAGATVVNTTCVTPSTDPHGKGAFRRGERISQGSSRLASEYEFERSAAKFREVGLMAADLGLNMSMEVHQGSIADNSTATNHLLDLIDVPTFGANPDLGNILWQFDEPEETSEAAIVALASRATYWHCKNLLRVTIEESNHTYFIRVPLPDGEIDYRFALSAMAEAKYQGYVAVEGMNLGDQLTGDGRSAAYVRGILAELGE